MKEESEKAGLKAKIMVCSPITSWQVDGETTNLLVLINVSGGCELVLDGTSSLSVSAIDWGSSEMNLCFLLVSYAKRVRM